MHCPDYPMATQYEAAPLSEGQFKKDVRAFVPNGLNQ
jgi:hypothetical protein